MFHTTTTTVVFILLVVHQIVIGQQTEPPSFVNILKTKTPTGDIFSLFIQPPTTTSADITSYEIVQDYYGPMSMSGETVVDIRDELTFGPTTVTPLKANAGDLAGYGLIAADRKILPFKQLDGGPFSFSARIKRTNTAATLTSTSMFIFDIGIDGTNNRVMLKPSNDQNKMHYSVKTTDGTLYDVSTTEAFPLNRWVLLQVAHRADLSVSIYWDGVEQGTGSSIPLPLATTSTMFLGTVGTGTGTAVNTFEGKMKEIVFRNSDETYTFETLTKRHVVATNQGTAPVNIVIPQLLPEPVLALPGLITFEAHYVRGFLNSRVIVPTAAYSGGAFSFVGWVKCLNPSDNWVRIFDLGTGEEDDNIFLTLKSTTAQMQYDVVIGDVRLATSLATSLTTTDFFPINKWVYVQLVHRADLTVTIYWDGIQKASGTNIPLPAVTERTWFLGESHWDSDTNFEGEMKELAFFNYEVNIFVKTTNFLSNPYFVLKPGLTNGVTNSAVVGLLCPVHWECSYNSATDGMFLLFKPLLDIGNAWQTTKNKRNSASGHNWMGLKKQGTSIAQTVTGLPTDTYLILSFYVGLRKTGLCGKAILKVSIDGKYATNDILLKYHTNAGTNPGPTLPSHLAPTATELAATYQDDNGWVKKTMLFQANNNGIATFTFENVAIQPQWDVTIYIDGLSVKMSSQKNFLKNAQFLFDNAQSITNIVHDVNGEFVSNKQMAENECPPSWVCSKGPSATGSYYILKRCYDEDWKTDATLSPTCPESEAPWYLALQQVGTYVKQVLTALPVGVDLELSVNVGTRDHSSSNANTGVKITVTGSATESITLTQGDGLTSEFLLPSSYRKVVLSFQASAGGTAEISFEHVGDAEGGDTSFVDDPKVTFATYASLNLKNPSFSISGITPFGESVNKHYVNLNNPTTCPMDWVCSGSNSAAKIILAKNNDASAKFWTTRNNAAHYLGSDEALALSTMSSSNHKIVLKANSAKISQTVTGLPNNVDVVLCFYAAVRGVPNGNVDSIAKLKISIDGSILQEQTLTRANELSDANMLASGWLKYSIVFRAKLGSGTTISFENVATHSDQSAVFIDDPKLIFPNTPLSSRHTYKNTFSVKSCNSNGDCSSLQTHGKLSAPCGIGGLTVGGDTTVCYTNNCQNTNGTQLTSFDGCRCGNTTCSRGTFCVASQNMCIHCEMGKVFNAVDSSCASCGAGQTSVSVIASCENCTAGKFQSSEATKYKCDDCIAGTYQDATAKSNCTICPGGKYSVDGPGQSSENTCKKCSKGKYSVGAGKITNTTCTHCEMGFYNNETARQACFPCDGGKFQNEVGQLNCKSCTPGKYSHNDSVKTTDICKVCPGGKYSTGTNFATPCNACPLGTFLIDPSTNGDAELHNEFTDCKNCSIGKYNPYAGHGKQCFTCGSALLPATTTCEGCGPGQFKNTSDACNECPNGFYTNDRDLDDCFRCDEGQHTPPLPPFIACTLCPKGKWGDVRQAVSEQTGCKVCATGRFSDSKGVASVDSVVPCVGCPQGRWSSETGVTKESLCINCDTGKYTIDEAGQSSEITCKSCDEGKFSIAIGASGSHTCLNCSIGSVQNIKGSAFCLPCTPGRYNTRAGGTRCVECAVGRSSTEIARNRTCQACPLGKFQPSLAATTCTSCIPGKYQSELQQTKCKNCREGRSSPEIARNRTCQACPLGKFQQSEAATTCLECGAGKFGQGCLECPIGFFRMESTPTDLCQVCELNYTSRSGAATCNGCEPGRYGSEPGICTECPTGFYQDSKTQGSCLSCVLGKNFITTRGECFGCDLGKYGSSPGLCVDCPAGRYQDAKGSSQCKPCPINTFFEGAGATALSQCEFCQNDRTTGMQKACVSSNSCLCKKHDYYTRDDVEQIGEQTCEICPDGAVCPKNGGTLSYIHAKPGFFLTSIRTEETMDCGDAFTDIKLKEVARTRCCHPNSTNCAIVPRNSSTWTTDEQCIPGYSGPLCVACANTHVLYNGECIRCDGGSPLYVGIIGLVSCSFLLFLGAFFVLKFTITSKEHVDDTKLNRLTGLVSIIISWLQILSALTVTYKLAWPRDFATYSKGTGAVVNLELISMLAVTSCNLAVPFINKFLLQIITPPLFVSAILMAWLLLKCCHGKKPGWKKIYKARAEHAMSMIVVIIQLLYPKLATRTFQMFRCIDLGPAVGSLLDADFSKKCFSGIHAEYVPFAIFSFAFYLLGLPSATFFVLYVNRKKLHEPHVESKFGDLYRQYEDRWYWWECALMVQKCFLTGAMVAIAPGSPLQLLIALIVCSAYMLMVLKAGPYKGDLEDRLAFLTSLCLTSSLLLGLCLMTDNPQHPVFDVYQIGAVLITINVLPFIYLISAALQIFKFGPAHGLVMSSSKKVRGLGPGPGPGSGKRSRSNGRITKQKTLMLVNKVVTHDKVEKVSTMAAEARSAAMEKIRQKNAHANSRLKTRLKKRRQQKNRKKATTAGAPPLSSKQQSVMPLSKETTTTGEKATTAGAPPSSSKSKQRSVMPLSLSMDPATSAVLGVTQSLKTEAKMVAKADVDLIRKKVQEKIGHEKLRELFDKLDKDQNNLLSRHEFKRLIVATVETKPTKQLFKAVWADACYPRTGVKELNLESIRNWISR